MNGNDPFETPPEQLALSYELLYLLQWIVAHEHEALQQLIEQAMRNKRLSDHHQADFHEQSDEDLQESILDLFCLLDALLLESEHQTSMNKAVEQDLMPSINQIDSSACDDATVLMSLDQTTAQLDAHPEQDAKKVLYEELLRRWEPDEQTLTN